ncbi:hypothetical protein [Actinokineospora xionganensis]|uniref:Uncharacterized protein n=1 Tax=Actinokineospora xionganensis TaxID=2684470 RepID=A0ABR7L509_9PSEU|nr:hypothetical protein [Actinokineospora xionganensis]MBC6447765.1 hypothetical protein [Actinokineospora xionganensis]
MTPAEAREALLFHSALHPDIDDPRWENGFLGSLRPFKGLREENFHEVMAALRVLAEPLQADQVPREVVSSLVNICHLGRAWGLEPGGMLRRNGLIGDADIERLDDWICTISYAFFCVLDGDVDEAFHEYDRR